MKHKGTKTTKEEEDLRRLLNEWNPIGVPGLPPDEYDCVIKPLLEKLRRGCNQEFIQRFLNEWIGEHFGLSGERGKEEFAARLLAWYRRPKTREERR